MGLDGLHGMNFDGWKAYIPEEYHLYTMSDAIAVKLPDQLKGEIDDLIGLGVFTSRSDALKFGARLVVMLEKMELPISRRAEEYALEEIQEKFKRIRHVR